MQMKPHTYMPREQQVRHCNSRGHTKELLLERSDCQELDVSKQMQGACAAACVAASHRDDERSQHNAVC